MLTRKDSLLTNPSTFEWDGMDMIRETDPSGNVTQYFIAKGVLFSFLRGGVTYQVHFDALGHVRLVTDSTGSAVFSASYDVWGNALAVTDSVPNGGVLYRFQGTWGVRWDADIQLYYCRQRWLSSGIQRFISRDLARSDNRYYYAYASPNTHVDVNGFAPSRGLGLAGKLPDISGKLGTVAEPGFCEGAADAASSILVGAAVVTGTVAVAIAVGVPAATVGAVVGFVGAVGVGVGGGLSLVDLSQAAIGRDLAGNPLSDSQRRYLAGQGVVGGLASAVGGRYLYNQSRFPLNRVVDLGERNDIVANGGRFRIPPELGISDEPKCFTSTDAGADAFAQSLYKYSNDPLFKARTSCPKKILSRPGVSQGVTGENIPTVFIPDEYLPTLSRAKITGPMQKK